MEPQSFSPHHRMVDFQPLGPLTSTVIFFLLLCALFSVFQIFVVVSDLELAGKIGRGEQITEREVARQRVQWSSVFWSQLAIVVLSGIVFLRWFHRAYCNVAQLSLRGTNHATKWAVWGWFVPFLNLYRPYAIAREMWDKCISAGTSTQVAAVATTNGSIVTFWWVSFVLAGALDRAAYQISARSESLDAALLADYTLLASDIVSIFAAFIAMSFVRELAARHDRAIRAFQVTPVLPEVMQPRAW